MARRLIDLIEGHADELTTRLVARIRAHRTTVGLRKYDDLELGRRAQELYSHLGYWLRTSSESEVEAAFREFGRAERREGIPASDLVGVLALTRRNLFEYVEGVVGDTLLDLRQEVDLVVRVMRFFDRATYFAVRGWEEPAWEDGAGTKAAADRAAATP